MYRSSAFASFFLRLCFGYTLYSERINDNKASLLCVKRVFSRLSESPKKNNRKTTQTTKKKAAKNHKKKSRFSLKTFSLFSLFSLSASLSLLLSLVLSFLLSHHHHSFSLVSPFSSLCLFFQRSSFFSEVRSLRSRLEFDSHVRCWLQR